jgi:hypothetical protein
MQSDTLKLWASTGTAVIMAIGGSLLLVYVWMQPYDGKDGLMALLAGFIGFAIQFLFGSENRTSAVRSFQAGLNTPVPVQPDA